MAYRKVNDISIASVADAIRAKGGTSDALVFPDGFVSAISAIQTGGGGDGGGGSGTQTGVTATAANFKIIYTYFPDAVSVTVTQAVTATSAAGELQ